MIDSATLALALLAGGALGTFVFGGLWLTIRLGMTARHPGQWFLGSLLVRMGVAVLGLKLVSGGDWKRLLAGLLGLALARPVVIWLTRPTTGSRILVGKGVPDAPQSR